MQKRNNFISRVLSLVLSIIMLFGMIPSITFAEPIEYVAINDENSAECNITYTLENISKGDSPSSVTSGSALSAKLVANTGYALPDTISVTVSGSAISVDNFSYDKNTGNVNIPTITQDINIVAKAVLLGVLQGKGTKDEPYLLNSKENLILLSKQINSGELQLNENTYFKQTANIDLSGVNWIPIGTSQNPFMGYYDGGGFNIENLSISSGNQYVGFFGYVGAKINNPNKKFADISGINLINPQVLSTNIDEGVYVGTLAGYIRYGSIIKNSVQCGNVEQKGSNLSYTGGMVGYNNTNMSSKFENCYSTANVKASDGYVGGLLGYCDRIMPITISNCYASGDVEGEGIVGGLIGYYLNPIKLNSVYASGSVKSTGSKDVGGLAGTGINIQNSVSINPSVENSDSDKIGRIVGTGSALTNNLSANATFVNGALISGEKTDNNGQNTSLDDLRNKSTWEALGFDFSTKWEWDEIGCYPKLAGMSGQTTSPYNFITLPLAIKKQPDDVILFAGEKAVFSVSAAGDPDTLSYEWQNRIGENCSWTVIEQLNSNVYTVIADESNLNNYYRCVIKDKTGSIESNTVRMIAAFHGGEGTEESPYIIKNADDLKLIAKYVNAPIGTHNSFKGKYFSQVNDIDLYTTKENPWSPIGIAIGNGSNTFEAAEYNGNGHKIRGLVLGKSNEYSGLFGTTNGTTIKDIHIDKPNIKESDVYNISSLIGYAIDTNVIGCSVTGGVLNGKKNNTAIGGIIGQYKFSKPGTYKIDKCYVDAKILTTKGSAGGILGNINNSLNGSSLEISNCYTTGIIATANNKASGIIGSADVDGITISNCYSTQTISGEKYIGGLVGSLGNNSIIKNSLAANKIISSPTNNLDINLAGRISGTVTGFENNFALASMLVGNDTVSQGTTADKNGLSKSIEELKNVSTWNSLNFDMTNIWEWDANQFPKLKGIPNPVNNPFDEEAIPAYALKIINQPIRKIIAAGDVVEFNVDAIGTQILYQWQISENNGIWKNIDGAIYNSYRINNSNNSMNGNRYRCVIKDYFDDALITNEVLLTIEDIYNNANEALSLYNFYKDAKGKNSILYLVKEPIAVYSYAGELTGFDIKIKYNGGYIGKVGNSSYEAPGEGLAALEWMIQGKNPLKYPANKSETDPETTEIDLINTILKMQDSLTGKISGSNHTYSDSSHIVQMMALEAFYNGKPWSNESTDKKLGRTAAIEYLLSNLKTDSESNGLYYGNVKLNEKYNENCLLVQCRLVVLLSRLSSDGVHGSKALEAMNGVLRTLSYAYQIKDSHLLDVKYIAEYISALVAANSVLNEHSDIQGNLNRIYEMFDLLRYAKNQNGTYAWKINYKNIPDDYDENSTIAVMTAFGDFINGRSIYATVTDMSGATLTPEEIVTRDLNELSLSTVAKEDLALPIKGKYGSNTAWESNNLEAITTDGKVTRLLKDVNVSLTATVSYEDYSASKAFKVLVPSLKNQDIEAVLEDLYALKIPMEAISDIELPLIGAHGSAMTWVSDNEAVISNEGIVTRPNTGESNAKVNLTVTAIKGNASETRTFEVLVYAKKDTVTEVFYAVREYFLKNRDLSNSYWEAMAAYSVLGDYVAEENGYSFYDVTKHKQYDPWYGTDYGAVVMQLIIMGENPYNYKGKNYVEGLLSSSGAWGAPIWKTMAIQAVGEDYIKHGAMSYCKMELDDLEFGPDLAAWAMVPIATYLEDYPDDESYKTHILGMIDKFNNGKLDGNDISIGCVTSGFMAMVGAGHDEFDLRKPEMKLNGVNVVDRLYNNNFKDGASFSGYNVQLALEFGDLYYGDSVWRRLAITKQDLSNVIVQAENIDIAKYTSDSVNVLTAALKAAKEIDNGNIFGKEYFTLKDAIKNLVEIGKVSIKVLGNAERPVILRATDVDNVLPKTTIEKVLVEALVKSDVDYKIESGIIQSIEQLSLGSNSCWYVYKNGVISYLSDEISEGDEIVLKYCADKFSLVEKFGNNINLDKHISYEDTENIKIEADLTAVINNLKLNPKGLFGSNISWSSSNESIIRADGTVIRLTENSKISLIANIKSGNEVLTKEFTVIVLGTNSGGSNVNNIKVSFMLLGDSKHGENISHVYKENPSAFKVWVSRRIVEVPLGSTVKDVFEKVLDEEKISYRYKGSNYIAEINGLAEFDNGKNSGWMYTVNGSHPLLGLNQYTLSSDDEIVWHYTDDYTKEEGSEAWNSTGTSSSSPIISIVEGQKVAEIIIKSEAELDNKGKATAVIVEKEILDIIANLVEVAKKEGENTKTLLSIDINANLTAKEVEIILPKNVIKEAQNSIDEIKISSQFGLLILNKEMLKSILEQSKVSEIKINMVNIDKEKLNENIKMILGERPIIDFSISSGDKKITSFNGSKIILGIPYTLKPGESLQKIVIYYIDDEFNLHIIRDYKYNDKAKMITFTTDHLSYYAIGYEQFEDIVNHWAENAINYIYGIGLVNGTSEDNFSPNKQMTRGMFVTVLGRLAGVNTENIKTGFSDVSQNQYYAPYIKWAVDNKLVNGKGNHLFAPNEAITREEMAVIMANYIKLVGKDIKTAQNEFADANDISIWAKDSVNMMQALGLIQGKNDNKFDPKSTATRAEVATIFVRLLKNILK